MCSFQMKFTSCRHGAGKKRSRRFRACETFARCTTESIRGKRYNIIQMRSLIGHDQKQHSIIYNERTVQYWEIGDDSKFSYRGTKMAHRLKKGKLQTHCHVTPMPQFIMASPNSECHSSFDRALLSCCFFVVSRTLIFCSLSRQ